LISKIISYVHPVELPLIIGGRGVLSLDFLQVRGEENGSKSQKNLKVIPLGFIIVMSKIKPKKVFKNKNNDDAARHQPEVGSTN